MHNSPKVRHKAACLSAVAIILLASCAGNKPTAREQLAGRPAKQVAPVAESTMRAVDSAAAAHASIHAARSTAESAARAARDATFAVARVEEELERAEIDGESARAAMLAAGKAEEEIAAVAASVREADKRAEELVARLDTMQARLDEADADRLRLEKQVGALQDELAEADATARLAVEDRKVAEHKLRRRTTQLWSLVAGCAILLALLVKPWRWF